MANTTNIRIIVEGRFEIDYESPEDLGIKFNRTVEDFTDLNKRFGEFSYTFSIPKTKNNRLALDFADVKGRRGIFVGTQKTCRVYNNDRLILDGVIELRSISTNVYNCAFFSKFSQLLDDIKGKKLNELLTLAPILNFNYEPDIISHLNANKSPDDTIYQFPYTYYGTQYTQYSLLNGAGVDFRGSAFRNDDAVQNWYYYWGSDDTTGSNPVYFHQLPLAIYIVPILEAILDDAGWTLGGSFFQREDIAKIVMMYTGDEDIYDQAIGCKDEELGACDGNLPTGGTDNIDTSVFLPSMNQTEFVKGLMNMFNLYFTIDVDNKIIKFETWDVLFGDAYDPFDITDMVFGNTVEFSRVDNYDPNILFKDSDNMNVLGDNKVMVTNSSQADTTTYAETESEFTSQVFNKIGTTGDITVPFGLPNVGRKYLRQDLNISGSDVSGDDINIFLPILTEQTIFDNNDNTFYAETGDTSIQNDESTIKFNGEPTLMWYYGQSDSDLQSRSGTDNSDLMYHFINNTRTKMGFANPFTLPQGDDLQRINDYLGSSPSPKTKDTAEVSYLKGLHYNIGKTGGDVADVPTFSLTFGEDDTYHKTLYTEFHKNKYDLYFNSELLTANMRMDEFTWNELTINRPIRYNDELYSIISIDNYDVVQNTASIKLIKK